MLEPGQAVADEDAVLVVQRHAVRHRAERDKGDTVDKEIAVLVSNLGPAAAGTLAERPSQLKRHARAAQMAEGVVTPR